MPIPKDMIGGLNPNLVGFIFESAVTNPIKATFSSKSPVEITREMYNDRYWNESKQEGVKFKYQHCIRS